MRFLYTYKENGEPDLEADQMEEEVSAVLSFNEEGYLVINEATDPAIMGWDFSRISGAGGMWTWVY